MRLLRGGRDRTRRTRQRSAAPAAVAPSPLVKVEAPKILTEKERAVWDELAPHALVARTLTPATVADCVDLCRLTVEMHEVLTERRAEGWTTRGMFLAKEYRGLVQRVEGKRRAFRLAPIGKELIPTEAPKDEWAEFDTSAGG